MLDLQTLESLDVVFFDVDETLIREKSMFTFLEFVLEKRGIDTPERQAIITSFVRQAATGMLRPEINRLYYQQWAGSSWPWLLEAGQDWYMSRSADFYLDDAVRLARRFKQSGSQLVLVSGSFLPCLAPIASELHADAILCTQPIRKAGVCTGLIKSPMIGANKATYANRWLQNHEFRRDQSASVGDHPSDADLLNLTAYGIYVGESSEMRRLANDSKWTHISEISEN